jgi:hypothetical protein
MINVNTILYIEELKNNGIEIISIQELESRLEALGYKITHKQKGTAKIDDIKNCDGNLINIISCTIFDTKNNISAYSTKRTNPNFEAFQILRDKVCVVFKKNIVSF